MNATNTPPVQITLTPEFGGSPVPRTVNYVTVEATPNLAFLNLGFVEPAELAKLGQAASAGREPSSQGQLVARVAMPLDVLAAMHQQTAELLQSLQKQLGAMLTQLSRAAAEPKPAAQCADADAVSA